MILKSCKKKNFICCKRWERKGDRAILNFGHTFAHGIETPVIFPEKLIMVRQF